MNQSKIVERIKENGYGKVDNFLDKKTLEEIDKILKNRVLETKIAKDDLNTYFNRDRDKNFILKTSIKLNFILINFEYQIYDILSRDLHKIKKKWKVEYEEKINSSVESLWELISSP